MKTYYITFRSGTHAQRGEAILTRVGLRCAIQRAPRWMAEQGCGYALRLRVEDLDAALGHLRRQALPVRKIYVQSGEGILTEVSP